MTARLRRVVQGDWLVDYLTSRTGPRQMVTVTVIAIALTTPFLFTGYVGDDHFFRMVFQDSPGMPEIHIPLMDMFVFVEGDPELKRSYMDRGLRPWWTVQEGRIAFWRPLTVVTHLFDHVAWRGRAFPAHVQSALWYVLVVCTATLVYRRFIPTPWIAGLAALLFALEDAHALPAGWLSNRNALLCAFFGMVTLLFHDRWRQGHSCRYLIFGLASLGIGVFAGEGIVGVGGYLFAYALFMDRGHWIRRLTTLLPYLMVIVPWRILYRALGYGVVGSGVYLDPVSNPVQFMRAFPRNFVFLMQGQFGTPESTIATFIPPPFNIIWLVVTLLFLGVCAWVLWPLLRSDRRARFWATGMVLSAIPVCAIWAQDRLLLFPSIGAMALIALFLGGWRESDLRVMGNKSRLVPGRLMVWYWSAVHIVLAPLLFVCTALLMIGAGKGAVDMSRATAMEPEITESTLVIVNTFQDNLVIGFPIVRSSLNDPVPRHTRVLSVGPETVHVFRRDATTLELRQEGGFFPAIYGQLFRSPHSHPMSAGHRVQLTGMTVEVLSSLSDGRPETVVFQFERKLEDSSYRFITWIDGDYVPFELPQIGQTRSARGLDVARMIRKRLGREKTSSP